MFAVWARHVKGFEVLSRLLLKTIDVLMPRRRWGLVSVSPCGVLNVFLHGNASNTDFTVFDASSSVVLSSEDATSRYSFKVSDLRFISS